MPTLYTTGTINQPDAGSVGLSMAEKIRDEVTTHEAWDLVEEFTAPTGTVRWYVFKCLAAQSGLSSDFFVVMGRILSNGKLCFCICEDYNAASHIMSYFPRYGSNSTVIWDNEGRNPQTSTLSTTIWDGSSTQYWSWTPAGTSTKWWILVTEDQFTLAFNGPSNGFVHAGVYIPLSALTIDMPLQIMGTEGSYSGSYGGITRNPAVAGASSQAYAQGFYRNNTYLGFRGDLRYNDRLQGNQRPVAEIGMVLSSSSGDEAIYGWALGKQKNIRAGNQSAPGFAFGDAYVLGGNLWVPYLPTDNWIWDTGIASS